MYRGFAEGDRRASWTFLWRTIMRTKRTIPNADRWFACLGLACLATAVLSGVPARGQEKTENLQENEAAKLQGERQLESLVVRGSALGDLDPIRAGEEQVPGGGAEGKARGLSLPDPAHQVPLQSAGACGLVSSRRVARERHRATVAAKLRPPLAGTERFVSP